MTSLLAGIADGLRYAAMPTFAAMAIATAAWGERPAEVLCGSSALNGMAMMYGLMSAFHAGPWLKLIGDRRSGLLPAPDGSLSGTRPCFGTKSIRP